MEYRKVDRWEKIPELKRLLDLSQPPKELFYRGTWRKELFADTVAVVGSRRMTEYGRRVLEKMIPPLVLAGKTIISGFMYGVDQTAHEITLDCGGKTIAVLGWGITYPLEERDKKLAQKLLSQGGLLISEWEDQRPYLWTFPARNRIVTALSKEVIVVEAALKSGSLITAEWARKLNRGLYAVPGPITSRTSEGTNRLVQAGLAKMWLPQDALPKLAKTTKDPLLKELYTDALTANDLARKLGKPVAEIGAQLSLLSLTGKVVEKGGKYYVSKV